MPFQSEKQRRYLHANHPEIAKRWERDYAGGGRIGFDNGSNGITLGSDKYNIKFEPGASGSLSSQDLGHGYNVDQKNISYGVDTTANIGPLEIGMDYKKFLDKYDVTKEGTTEEKDTNRDRSIAYMLGLNLEDLYAKIDSDKDFKNFYFTIRKTFSGGGTPAHQAGIYGLAEGGRTGFFTGAQADTASGKSMSPGTSADYSPGQGHRETAGGPPGITTSPTHIPKVTQEPPSTKDKEDKIKEWVTTETKKVPKFATNLALAKKLNIPFLGASYITDKIIGKFKDKDKDKTLGLTGSIDFGLGLKDDTKVKSKLGDTDFSEIEGDVAFKVGSKKDKKLKALHNERKAVIDLQNLGMDIEFDSKKEQEYQDLKKEDQEQTTEPKTILVGAEGGIAGLKDGGRTGFFTGMREAEQQDQHGDVAHGPGGRFDVVNQPTQTTPREAPPGEKGGPGYVSSEDLQKQRLKDFVNQQEKDWGKYDDPLDKWNPETTQGAIKRRQILEKQALDNWNQVKDTANTWAKKKAGKAVFDHFLLGGATFGLSDLIGGLVQGFKTNKAKNEFINTLKASIGEYQKLGFAEQHHSQDTLIQDLNQQLLDLTQTRSTPEDGGDGITYPAIARVNDKREMELASTRWRQEQKEVDRSKQMAYWQMMMTPYMKGATPKMLVAQGGRVPEGYNTGGLSNLFRLKNR